MTELLPCPLCGSTKIDSGICYLEDKSKSEPAVRCVDCGCRATLAAWSSRTSEGGKCYGSTTVSKTVSAGSTPAPSAIPASAQGAQDHEALQAAWAEGYEFGLNSRDKTPGDIEPLLKDPVAVHINMLRGRIAKPSWAAIKHLYPEHFQPEASQHPEGEPLSLKRRSEADAYYKILQTIARFPITDPKNQDAVNLQLIAKGALELSSTVLSGQEG